MIRLITARRLRELEAAAVRADTLEVEAGNLEHRLHQADIDLEGLRALVADFQATDLARENRELLAALANRDARLQAVDQVIWDLLAGHAGMRMHWDGLVAAIGHLASLIPTPGETETQHERAVEALETVITAIRAWRAHWPAREAVDALMQQYEIPDVEPQTA